MTDRELLENKLQKPLTMNQLRSMWADTERWRRLAATTRQAADTVFLRAHGNTPLTDFSPALATRWLNEATAPAADVVLALSCLRNMTDWASDAGLLRFRGEAIKLDTAAFNARRAPSAPEPPVHDAKGKKGTTAATEETRHTGLKAKAKAVGSRVKSAAKKALHRDILLAGSARWVGKTIGKVLDRSKSKPHRRTLCRPSGKAFTPAQSSLRTDLVHLGYVLGRWDVAEERNVIFVTPNTHRRPRREMCLERHGFILMDIETRERIEPLRVKTFSKTEQNMRKVWSKRGLRLGNSKDPAERKKIYIPNSYRLRPCILRTMHKYGYEVVVEPLA